MPTEAPEAILNTVDVSGNTLTGALSLASIEVLDLWCEGKIKGPVSGKFEYAGTIGNIGWDSATFTPYGSPKGYEGSDWLHSIFWNEVPILSSNNQFNFQRVEASYTVGTPNGTTLTSGDPNITISRTLGERLRASVINNSTGEPTSQNADHIKYYRIFNKECKGAIINVKVNGLAESDPITGDVKVTSVSYNIYYRPILASQGTVLTGIQTVYSSPVVEIITGKINYSYIRSTTLNFDSKILEDKSFIGWELRIVRTTPDSTNSYLRNATIIDSITEIYKNTYTYPNSSLFHAKFDAEFFSQIPGRAYELEGLLVKIPSNYDPNTRQYTGKWNGTFAAVKQWTNNPAWIYYDLITNRRYGLGKYISESNVDKWTLYDIAKYCDELVSDGLGGLEPRFVCNLLLNTREEAYKVIGDLASVFNGITYYAGGTIFAVQDKPKVPFVLFTNANVEDGNFSYSSTSKRVRHTVALIRWNDPSNFYKPAAEYVEDVIGIRKYGIRQLDLTSFGTTSRGQAIRAGRYALVSETTETETVNFIGGLEAAVLRPGQVFKTFDANRKTQRLGGRVTQIENYATGTWVHIDSTISIDPTRSYNLNLLTPSWILDPTTVNLRTDDDLQFVNKSYIQTLLVSGVNINTDSNGYNALVSLNTLNLTDYSTPNKLVWALEPTGITGYLDNLAFTDSGYDYYRAVKIEEKEDFKFSVLGVQYNPNKYIQIESGLSFQTPPATLNLVPAGPTSIYLSLSDQSNNIQNIDYEFTVPNSYTSINYFQIYVKKGEDFSDSSVPDISFSIERLPVSRTRSTYASQGVGDYYFRVYSVNSSTNPVTYSSTYAANNIHVNKSAAIQDMIISNLGVDNETSNSYKTFGGSYNYNSVRTTSADAVFIWQTSEQEGSVYSQDQFKYRLTLREPSPTEVPSRNIYYENDTVTSPYKTHASYDFPFSANAAIVGGPYRKYDVVVEMIQSDGLTSAGNSSVGPVENGWQTNPQGYDICLVENYPLTGLDLSYGATTPTGYTSKQWVGSDMHGLSVALIENVGFTLPDDIQGVFAYTSTQSFLKNQTGDSSLNIKRTQGSWDAANRLVTVPNAFNESIGTLTRFQSAYMGISFYDSFDLAWSDTNSKWYTGLYVSNIVQVSAQPEVATININNNAVLFDANDSTAGAKSVALKMSATASVYKTAVTDSNGNEIILSTYRHGFS